MPEAQTSGRLQALVLAGAAVLLFTGLGLVDAWAPDEPRYIQVAEEVRSLAHGSKSLLLLHLNGDVYTQKPPLYFWAAALVGAPLGHVSEAAARLPSALSGLALVGVTLLFGRRLFGGAVGLLGAALLLTVFEFAHVARRVQLDVMLALFETIALLCFFRADRGIGRRALAIAGMHAALGLAVLTKGPVGLLVPLLVIACFLAWERRLGDLPALFPPWALSLSLAPGLLWLAGALALAPGGFASEALGTNQLGRFFSGTSHHRPFHYFLLRLPVDFLPWTLLWPLAFVAARNVLAGANAEESERRAWRLLLSWLGASLLFFSLSAGKRGVYLLPAYPAVALLCADSLRRMVAGRARLPRGLVAAIGLFAAILAAAAIDLVLAARFDTSLLIPTRLHPGLVEPLALAFGCAVLSCILAAIVAVVVLERHRASPLRCFAAVLVGAGALELAVFLLLYPALDPIRSPRAIAEAAAALTPPGEPIALVGNRAKIGGLAYYAERRVVPLPTPESIADYLAGGGRTIVVKAEKVDRLQAHAPIRVLDRRGAGKREFLVVQPSADTYGAARRRTAP